MDGDAASRAVRIAGNARFCDFARAAKPTSARGKPGRIKRTSPLPRLELSFHLGDANVGRVRFLANPLELLLKLLQFLIGEALQIHHMIARPAYRADEFVELQMNRL